MHPIVAAKLNMEQLRVRTDIIYICLLHVFRIVITRYLKVRLLVILINDELRKQTNEIEQITRHIWDWIDHTVWKENAIEEEAVEWSPQGQRKRGVTENNKRGSLGCWETWGEVNSARIVWYSDTLLVPYAPVGAEGRRRQQGWWWWWLQLLDTKLDLWMGSMKC
jgi:hypothetical protein